MRNVTNRPRASPNVSAPYAGAIDAALPLLPPELPLAALLDVYRGMAASARRAGVVVVGGNVSRTEGPFSVGETLLGTPVGSHAVPRSGGRAGNLLVLTGTPGTASVSAARRIAISRASGPSS